jgi:hypothetical protein
MKVNKNLWEEACRHSSDQDLIDACGCLSKQGFSFMIEYCEKFRPHLVKRIERIRVMK